MAKNRKKNAKQRREEQKEKLLSRRINKVEDTIPDVVSFDEQSQVMQEHIEEHTKENNFQYSEPQTTQITPRESMEIERIRRTKRNFEDRKKDNARWQSKMPIHKILPVPSFLTDASKKEERLEVVEKLRTMLKQKFLLSEIADILLYNNYGELDAIISERRELCASAMSIYPSFGRNFKQKAGSEISKEYSSEEKRMKAIIDFLEAGTFISSRNVNAFQDTVSTIVDTPKFNSACRIETEFLISELDALIMEAEKAENRRELEDLISKAFCLQTELTSKKEAYRTIEELVNNKSIQRLHESSGQFDER